MPPKNKKKEVVQDERFQAIVLTDLFETRFLPLTARTPRCLLPLANVPLIEYTLAFLAKTGVNEVYLMCSAHADQIQQYIEQLKWARNSAFAVSTINSAESRSVGDAMRDLDNRGIVSGDFLLVSGDVVTNVDFARALQFHRGKRAADKDHIVTMVLSAASPNHRTRSQVDPAVFVLDKASHRCHYYEDIAPRNAPGGSVAIEPELLENMAGELEVRNDLIDCHIDICLPHVPQIFQENFDYQSLRGDFVRGVLTSDLVRKSIYAYITSEYAARVELWATYAAVSQDVLARWAHPLVPDSNLAGGSYEHGVGHVYKEQPVVLAQLCTVGSSTCVGAGTNVGAGSTIRRSVVGRRCRVGSDVKISNSYIWDDAVIEDGAEVSGAVVASGATVGHGARLLPGSVVDFGETVSAGETRSAETGGAPPAFYLQGNGSDELIALVSRRRRRSSRRRRMSSASTDFSDDEDFATEAVATVERAMEHNHDMDTALLELNTLRMSMNVTYHEVRAATVEAMVRRVAHFESTATLGARDAASKVFGEWGGLFRRQVFSASEQDDLAELLEMACAPLASGAVVLFVALRQLYELDIVEEESILRWWTAAERDRPQFAQVRTLAGQFVEWLRDAEEESDSD